ncbi:acyltransferase [Pseudomonas beijingensis]|uniref:Acyltransferase n=1 Tax=Pseudomonas beijingensis TaxID=2954101 RepID=A0ABY9FH30_9PSED|nr:MULTISPECIES: acyltransferase [unclassified Pseudomonas]WLH02849.1 acyltransferase [Pseudomonas sp. FP2034]WLI47680.1 acyltransferase [Pseudomonas sp. FP830]
MKGLLVRALSKFVSVMRSTSWKITYAMYREQYELNKTFRFNGYYIQFYGPGRIEGGRNSYIGELSTIQSASECVVVIGANCRISHNVRIYTSSAMADSDFSKPPVGTKQGDVKIGDFCWVGANVFINPDVTIGENSVVGANSVVTKNIPPNEIWGGVPAKLIRRKACAAI